MTNVDQLFNRIKPQTGEFAFDENVAEVFDDMISRSVPLYEEVQQLIPSLAGLLDHDPIKVVDLGCSTGTSLIHLAEKLPERNLELIGVDNSRPMIEQCEKKIAARGLADRVSIFHEDIRQFAFEDVSIVLMNYTLQFVPIDSRLKLLDQIRNALRPGGFLILSEKFIHDDVQFDQSLVELYFDYKRQKGYSELEISRKRDALENVLVPFSVKENERLLLDAGFDEMELILKWFNFGTFLAHAKK
ncbi:MAG: carboxy-S-adenosyl-L-methionine synthase CmoA [Planctomycetota bacterium]|nr:carboxy-S-adenosyl-L-methionine synthase CmoA [Planctomycetota bacterium]